MQLKGTIKKINETQTFASGFQKREMVLLTEEQYPQPISIEFLQDKSDLIDPYKEGDSVTVSINIGGREWTSPTGEVKFFNSITGWRIEKDNGESSEPSKAGSVVKGNTATPQQAFDTDEDDSELLPF